MILASNVNELSVIGDHMVNEDQGPSYIFAMTNTKTLNLHSYMSTLPHDETSDCRFLLSCFDLSKTICSYNPDV